MDRAESKLFLWVEVEVLTIARTKARRRRVVLQFFISGYKQGLNYVVLTLTVLVDREAEVYCQKFKNENQ